MSFALSAARAHNFDLQCQNVAARTRAENAERTLAAHDAHHVQQHSAVLRKPKLQPPQPPYEQRQARASAMNFSADNVHLNTMEKHLYSPPDAVRSTPPPVPTAFRTDAGHAGVTGRKIATHMSSGAPGDDNGEGHMSEFAVHSMKYFQQSQHPFAVGAPVSKGWDAALLMAGIEKLSTSLTCQFVIVKYIFETERKQNSYFETERKQNSGQALFAGN